MNEEIKNRLIKYLDSLESIGKNFVDLGSQEIPLYIQELLNWMFWESFLYLVSSLIVILSLTMIGIKSGKFCQERWDNNDYIYPPPAIVYALFFFIVLILVPLPIINFHTMVKVSIAPRVVLIEKLMEMR